MRSSCTTGASHLHFHDLIAALAGARIQHALFAQPEFLPVLGALRNLQQRAAVDGGHFDLGAQPGFVDAHRHGDLDIVAFAAEERMRLHAQRDVQIARRRAHGSGVSLARDSQPRALLRARRNAHLHGFGGGDAAVAMSKSGSVLRSRPVPSQRGHVRLKRIAPATCVTLPLPLHSGTNRVGAAARARAAAGRRRLPGG